MSKHRESIDRLIEQSSLGTPDARAARASVPRAAAKRIVAASAVTNLSATGRNAVTGRYVRRTKIVRGEG